MNVRTQLEIYASAYQWVDNFMKTYNISATEMSDALTKVLITLKDKSFIEYLIELNEQKQKISEAPQEEEVNDTY